MRIACRLAAAIPLARYMCPAAARAPVIAWLRSLSAAIQAARRPGVLEAASAIAVLDPVVIPVTDEHDGKTL